MGDDRTRQGEHGYVAGAEALILGVLVFVFGTLLIVNGWRVVDAKFATNAAAREAVRAVIEAQPGATTEQLAVQARGSAAQALLAHGYDVEVLTLTPLTAVVAGRCDPVRYRAQLTVRSTIVPGLAGPGSFTVSSEHEEVMYPFRSGLPGEADCAF